MAIAKVILNGTTLIDLTQDTAVAEDIISPKTAHKKDGTSITGSLSSLPAQSGGTDMSLVTTGEKYTWNNKADASSALTLTLAAGSWTSATPPTQTVTATGVTASNHIVVGIASTITSAQYDAASAAKLVCTAQAANSITITAYGDKPTENIPISVVILG